MKANKMFKKLGWKKQLMDDHIVFYRKDDIFGSHICIYKDYCLKEFCGFCRPITRKEIKAINKFYEEQEEVKNND